MQFEIQKQIYFANYSLFSLLRSRNMFLNKWDIAYSLLNNLMFSKSLQKISSSIEIVYGAISN
jgi:hypothetical protein